MNCSIRSGPTDQHCYPQQGCVHACSWSGGTALIWPPELKAGSEACSTLRIADVICWQAVAAHDLVFGGREHDREVPGAHHRWLLAEVATGRCHGIRDSLRHVHDVADRAIVLKHAVVPDLGERLLALSLEEVGLQTEKTHAYIQNLTLYI